MINIIKSIYRTRYIIILCMLISFRGMDISHANDDVCSFSQISAINKINSIIFDNKFPVEHVSCSDFDILFSSKYTSIIRYNKSIMCNDGYCATFFIDNNSNEIIFTYDTYGSIIEDTSQIIVSKSMLKIFNSKFQNMYRRIGIKGREGYIVLSEGFGLRMVDVMHTK